MSEFCFGVTHTQIRNARVTTRIDEICREEGGNGFTAAEGKQWFTARNYGFPFNDRLANRVLARVREEFPIVAAVAWPD
jgi:hypothetical protein